MTAPIYESDEFALLKKAQADWDNAEYLLNAIDDDELEVHGARLLAAQTLAEQIMENSLYHIDHNNQLQLK